MKLIQEGLAWGAAYVIAGLGVLSNLDRLVQLDQSCSAKLQAWFRAKLGEKSLLNRELWPARTERGLRSSRIWLRLAAIFSILFGLALLAIALYFTRPIHL